MSLLQVPGRDVSEAGRRNCRPVVAGEAAPLTVAAHGCVGRRKIAAAYPSGLRGRIANPLFKGSNPFAAFPIVGFVDLKPFGGKMVAGTSPPQQLASVCLVTEHPHEYL